MKKLILLLSTAFLLTSCFDKVEPIEKYKNKYVVVIGEPEIHERSWTKKNKRLNILYCSYRF